jgi:hypothetical protein
MKMGKVIYTTRSAKPRHGQGQYHNIFKDPDKVQPYPQCPGNLEASLSISDTCRNPLATNVSFDNLFLGNM